ncbi:hypothetical protein DFP72DRAFT_992593 [Ephemerocybe angulata]|uniref:Reverse transcriptase zinc-binding domain-containing protein n=1 Tax=Ephemerocybe angulata TaxID=980116 RepID=A0A8H6HHQ8_9AGAR|nr:hypothetical protein DFP72DRAFT_992593 [Tulosesus angulatus]
MTQSVLYKGIRRKAVAPVRQSTQRHIEAVTHLLEENTGTRPRPSQVWASLARGHTLSKKSRVFLWKAMHNAHKVGCFWEHTKLALTRAPCRYCDVPRESLEHILFECKASGQEYVWDVAKEYWANTGHPWPELSFTTLLSISLYEIRDDEGALLVGLTRLFHIIISESLYLMWILRWLAVINRRLKYDRILTNKSSYGRKALNPLLVRWTWEPLMESTYRQRPHPDWATNAGVLVGMGGSRRPPGRNR